MYVDNTEGRHGTYVYNYGCVMKWCVNALMCILKEIMDRKLCNASYQS